MRKSKTLGKQSMNAGQISHQPVPVGRLMAMKTLGVGGGYYFWSTFVDNIDAFDCRLSGVNSMLRWTFLHTNE